MKTPQNIAIALLIVAIGVTGYYTYELKKQVNTNSEYVGGIVNYLNTQITAGTLSNPPQQ